MKALESDGIGRPSTYAAIVETIQNRGYVEQEDRKFYPTALGEVVTDKLVQHFPQLMDVKFTSHMEDELDKIEEAHLDWVHVLREFHDPFKSLLSKAGDEMDVVRSQPSEYECPRCSERMVYRWGKLGRFLSCSKYPECKGTLNVDREGKPLQSEGQAPPCELCGKEMIVRQSRTGIFLGCSGYPDCRNTAPCDEHGAPLETVDEADLTQPCDACGEGALKVKWKGRQAFLGCDRYPKCKNTSQIPKGVSVKKKPAAPPEDAGVPCDKCGKPMVIRKGSRGAFVACSGFPRCRNTKPVEKLDELRAVAAAAPTPTEKAKSDATPTVARKKSVSADGGKLTANEKFGEPHAGFAWTRTGRPVVEIMPGDHKLPCPECGETMELKRGRFGPFFSCSNFPRCKFVSNLRGEAKKEAEDLMPAPAKPKPIPTDIPCEECGAPMFVRQGPRGKFLGCSAYPKCKTTQELPAGFEVPEMSESK